MSWVCCAEDNSKMAYHATIKTEFQRVDPKTQRVYEQLVHF